MKNAFTSVELPVVTGIFSLIVGAISGLFISGVSSQKRILAEQELLSQTSYVIEYMSRALRMAKKDDGTCIGDKLNYKIEGAGIKFRNYKDECQKFYLEGGQLKESRAGTILPLTSTALRINSFRLNSSGETQYDDLQPKVTIFLEILGRGQRYQPKLQIQTTISQRNLDVRH